MRVGCKTKTNKTKQTVWMKALAHWLMIWSGRGLGGVDRCLPVATKSGCQNILGQDNEPPVASSATTGV